MEFGKTHILLAENGVYLVKPETMTQRFDDRIEITAAIVSPKPDHGKAWPGGKPNGATYGIERVIFNDPATVVIWADGTKTVVKCQPGDTYSKETGLALCIAKKYLGNKSNFNEVFKKWIPEEVEIPVEEMRNALYEYCDIKSCCSACALDAPVCRCGCGTHFFIKNAGRYDMTDDEIRAAYKVAFKWGGLTVGFCEVLTIIFVLLKVFGKIAWSWWLVFLPEIIAVVLYLIVFSVGLFSVRKTTKSVRKHFRHF